MCSSRRIRAAREFAAEHGVGPDMSKIVSFKADDARMQFAIDQAKASLRTFFDAFVSPKDNQKSFLLKVYFEVEGEGEHIWLADIDASVMPLTGTIANEPSLPGMTFMNRAFFHPSQITDWMYVEDGYLVGGYTTQVIRAAMSPEERAEYESHAPYKFRD
jgi:uncharacterized protein YegJ (DUF2314 family)